MVGTLVAVAMLTLLPLRQPDTPAPSPAAAGGEQQLELRRVKTGEPIRAELGERIAIGDLLIVTVGKQVYRAPLPFKVRAPGDDQTYLSLDEKPGLFLPIHVENLGPGQVFNPGPVTVAMLDEYENESEEPASWSPYREVASTPSGSSSELQPRTSQQRLAIVAGPKTSDAKSFRLFFWLRPSNKQDVKNAVQVKFTRDQITEVPNIAETEVGKAMGLDKLRVMGKPAGK